MVVAVIVMVFISSLTMALYAMMENKSPEYVLISSKLYSISLEL